MYVTLDVWWVNSYLREKLFEFSYYFSPAFVYVSYVILGVAYMCFIFYMWIPRIYLRAIYKFIGAIVNFLALPCQKYTIDLMPEYKTTYIHTAQCLHYSSRC